MTNPFENTKEPRFENAYIFDTAKNMFTKGADVHTYGAYYNEGGSQTPGDRWCIAVLDETGVDHAVLQEYLRANWISLYSTFRTTWPNRKLFLLIPSSAALVPVVYTDSSPGTDFYTLVGPSGNGDSSVFVPKIALDEVASGLFTGPTKVNRDEGVVGNLTDWFSLTGMSVLSPGAKVGLFVDNSGSMTTATVQASYNKFVADVAAAGLSIITVTNANEDWITPFIGMSGV
jgi:hypothetical protein